MTNCQILIVLLTVYCQSVVLQGCIEGDLQLQSAPGFNKTFLQYCFNNTWRRVCQGRWRQESARVACRQLGYSDEEPNYGLYCDDRNQASVRLYRFCSGTENRLQECGLEDIQCVVCNNAWLNCKPICTNGEVRLVNGSTNRDGRMEVCLDGHWGTVCSRKQEGIAEVVCSQLGFPAGITSTGTFPPGSVPISSCTVHTGGNLSCTKITDSSCNHSMDLGAVCLTHDQYMELLGQCLSTATTTSSLLTMEHEYFNETTTEATLIVSVLAAASGVLMLLLTGTVTALIATCARKTNVRANRGSSSVGETADLPTTANPAYEAVKQNQGDEDHYSYVTVN